jgi:ArsR family transcriptional regulator, arsenate/arsenite/antimonite-responsive transcriptional repressor
MSEVYKALADPTRRRIIQLLREKEMSAGDIADHFSLAKPTLSGHFAVLKTADLVATEKQGASVIYRLNLSVLEEALMALMDGFGLLAAKTPTATPNLEGKAS